MNIVNWTDKQKLKNVIKESINYSQVLRTLNIGVVGSNFKTLKKYITLYNISTMHFEQGFERMVNLSKISAIPLSEIIEGKHPTYRTYPLKRRLIKEGIKENKCEVCGLDDEWNEMKINMQLDHINGQSTDHRLSNLRIICPNCHSQTPTFAGKNQAKAGTSKWRPTHGNRQNYNEFTKQQYNINQQQYIDKVLSSNIDFSKFGWVQQVSVLINQKPQKVNTWMKRMMSEFYDTKCYKRKSRLK